MSLFRAYWKSNVLRGLTNKFAHQQCRRHRAVRLSRFSTSTQEDFGDYHIILPPEPHIWGTAHITPRLVPSRIPRPPYAVAAAGSSKVQSEPDDSDHNEGDGRIELGGEQESRLRNAANLAKRVRNYASSLVQVGVTTNAIDAAIHEFIISHLAYPSPLHYLNFPRSCCASVNNIIAHGLPDERPLENGDIINLDITVFLDGFHGDTSETFLVGDVDVQGRQLVQVTNEALEVGIQSCGPGRPFRGIGRAIHDLASGHGYSVSPLFMGHGIANEEPGVMLPGHCFTIEPCLVQGFNPSGWIFPDGWTTSTENCARSAQAEHMVLITETGIAVLTQ